ncbi:hypothetical protein D3C74_285140 [compost metagenome]
MGYTHYWYRKKEISQYVYSQIKSDFQKLLPAFTQAGVVLAGARGLGDPLLTDHDLRFNGRGRDSYEEFDFPRVLTLRSWDEPDERGHFQFCKTAERPYDLAVTSLLLIAKHHLQQDFTIGSDGGAEDWEAARKLCQMHLGFS